MWSCLGIAILSFIVILNLFYKAFPEASIRFEVTKNQSQQIAEHFLQSQSIDISNYKHAVVFDYDNRAKTFLEKELEAEQANQIMGSRVRLWRWSNRWFKPLDRTELNVNISPQGELTGFAHIIPEEAVGDSLVVADARTLAEHFLKTLNIYADTLEFIEHSQQDMPNRSDHIFVWKLRDFDINGSEYRYLIKIQGDQIGSYKEFLHIPDSWTRGYEKLRAKNNTTGYVASFLLLLTLAAMLVMLINHTRNLDVKWKTAFFFGITAAVLTLLSQLNDIPLSTFYFDTTESWSSFFMRHILMDVIMALMAGAAIFFLTAAAEPLYRERYPQQTSLTRLFTWQSIRSKSFFIATIVGITMTFAFVAYQVIFYLAADKFGGWAPQDIPYSNMLNTAFPWVYVLLSGFIPAVSEEFISRMFSIPFFNKFVKKQWIAVIIPAFIWGFAHANYAQEPFYIRGLEVGIAGVIIGFVMLRFGILATLVWHYSIDALYTALVLLRSNNPYLIFTASLSCGILLIPLFISLIAFLKTRTFLSESDISNKNEGTSHIEHTEEKEIPAIRYSPLPRKRLFTGIVIALALCCTGFIKTEKIDVKYPTRPQQARAAADAFLQQHNVSVDSFKTITYATDRFNSLAAKYVLEHSDFSQLNTLFMDRIKAPRWAIRYYIPLQKAEYRVHLDPKSLKVLAFSKLVDDEAPGAALPPDSALFIAQNFAMQQGCDLDRYKLVQDASEKMKNRTDYRFEWESLDSDSLTIQDMHLRIAVDLQGDIVSRFTIYPKIPEAWQRQREKQTALNTLHLGLRLTLLLGLVVLGILRFIRIASVGSLSWKRSLVFAGIIAILFFTDALTQFNMAFKYYNTSISIPMFQISTLLTILLSTLFIFAGLAMLFSMSSAIFPGSLYITRQRDRNTMFWDAIITSVIAVTGLWGITQIQSLLSAHFSKFVFINSLPVPSFIDAPLPFFSNLVYILYMTLFITVLTGLLVFILHDVFKKALWIGLFSIPLILALITLQVRTLPELLFQSVLLSIILLWLVYIITMLARNNYLTYFFAPLLVLGAKETKILLNQGNLVLTIQGIIIAILIVAIFALFRILPGTQNKSV